MAYTWDGSAGPRLAAAAAALEAAGDREFLPSILTVLGMIKGETDPAQSIALLHRAVELAQEAGHTYTEGWTRGMIVYSHFLSGALDEAQRVAEESVRIARRQHNDEGAAFALIGCAFVNLKRGNLAAAREDLAEGVALARSRGAAWPRCMALTCLSSVIVATGDHANARALLEEALHYSIGTGFIAIDTMCGAIALMLAQEGERERALRVFAAVRPGAEDESGINAELSDPTGALRQATRQARQLLGNPPSTDPDTLDLTSVVQAALGADRAGSTMAS
jgi:ATP/maltotriose-dependent transcriptional regulator MalT